jgi:hypothetical protein
MNQWHELYTDSSPPKIEEINTYLENTHFKKLHNHLQETYGINAKLEYSACSWINGWNLKYKKRGKNLCTIYPINHSLFAMVTIGKKEMALVEENLASYLPYVQKNFQAARIMNGSKALILAVSTQEILDDVLSLLAIRGGK